MADSTTLNTARELTESVMTEAPSAEPVHKLASALHLVIETLSSAPQPATAEQMRAAYEHAVQAARANTAGGSGSTGGGGGVIEAAPPTEQIRTLASVPPGSYEAPRNEDGTVATGPASAPSLYEQRRNDDGSIASE